jgi:hypothetical protein
VQLDLRNEYPSHKQCINKTKEYAKNLVDAMYEQLEAENKETAKLFPPPAIIFNCKYMDYRKA